VYIDVPKQNVFRENIVFGCLPIGNPADLSFNMVAHLHQADILIVESHEQFSRLLTEFRQSSLSNGIVLRTNADIYQYDLDSGISAISRINQIVMENYLTKKILIVSDEGSSVFLEPACTLKSELSNAEIPFQVISGPNSMVTTLLSSDRSTNEFYFGCGISAIRKDRRSDIFEKIKNLGIPAVFLLTGVESRESIEDLQSAFGNYYYADFSINLSMYTEEHVRGSFTDILNYIDYNSDRFSRDTEVDKYSIIIYPPHQDNSHYIIYDFETEDMVKAKNI
jgi:16S rRNA C1402 (ribose-2'-O) methylase RsmI